MLALLGRCAAFVVVVGHGLCLRGAVGAAVRCAVVACSMAIVFCRCLWSFTFLSHFLFGIYCQSSLFKTSTMSATPVQSPGLFSMRMDFSNIGALGSGVKRGGDPIIDSWSNIMTKSDKIELMKSDMDANTIAVEEEIKRGTLNDLRGLLKEIDSTAWMYQPSS